MKPRTPSKGGKCASCSIGARSLEKNALSAAWMSKETLLLMASGVAYAIGVVLALTGRIGSLPAKALFVLSYLLAGIKVLKLAAIGIVSRRPFDENFLLAVATLGAFAIGEYPEAAGVMLFFRVGEHLQDLALARSRRSIEALLDLKADYANLKVGERIVRVDPAQVKVGDIIVVRPGERIPLDGRVVKGSSSIDTSPLTGESIPRLVKPGDEVLSGTINLTGVLEVKVTKELSKSTVARILELVEKASARKAKVEKFITRFARYYTPSVIATALAIAFAPPLLYGEPLYTWVYRALVLLVISCPCALVLSIPLGYFGGLGRAAKEGILIKGSNFLDQLAELEAVAFDKTGTLTKGVFRVTTVHPRDGFTAEELLKIAALAEVHSNHPIAQAIKKAWRGEVDLSSIERYEELAGMGVKASVGGMVVMVGNDRLLHVEKIEHDVCDVAGGTIVHVVVNGKYAGYILISDEVKQEAKQAIRELRKLGVRKILMLTGDSRHVAEVVARELGVDKYYAELLPQDKVEVVERISRSTKGRLAFVGDGINDAPVIARADVGIAMGALGSDAAIEVADVVVMDDNLMKVPKAVKVGRVTKRIVLQNIIFVLAVKALFLGLGAMGEAGMWEALFADVGAALITVLNAIRVLKVKL